MPEVDVIIPCRAPAPWLEQALRSIFHDNIQITAWVVDDGSVDESVYECVAGLKDDRIHYQRQTAAGPSSARNTALGAGAAPWLVYLDADDYFLPGGISRMLEAGASAGGVVLAGWQDVSTDGCRVLATHSPQSCSNQDPLSTVVQISPPLGPVLLPRTAVAWDENRRVWEVTRYINRAVAEVDSVTVLPTCVAALRQHNSATRLSHSERHFAVDVATAFWIEEYEWLCALSSAGAGARRIVAERLLGLAYAGVRSGDLVSTEAAATILLLARRDDWRAELRLRAGSAGWVATRFGLSGLRGFSAVNMRLGR